MPWQITLRNYRCFTDSEPTSFILESGVTAFLGANNSGKSSIIRFFYEFRDLFRRISTDMDTLRSAANQTTISFGLPPEVPDVAELFCNTNQRSMILEVERVPQHINTSRPEITRARWTLSHGTGTYTMDVWINGVHFDNKPVSISIGPEERRSLVDGNNSNHVYSSLNSFIDFLTDLTNMFYIGPFRNAINIGSMSNYYDIQIGQAFLGQWRAWKTGPNIRANQEAYRVTQDLKRIFRFEELEINTAADDQTLHLIVDGQAYRLPSLGAGLSQFLVVLVNVAIRRPSYVLIDEPEMNLHPALQQEFLTALKSYASEGLLFSTHSIGLARVAADRRYSLRRLAEGHSQLHEYEANPRLSELLGELSFSGYRELGIHKVLLVEGPNDSAAIKELLRKYGKEHDFLILTLGGGSLIHGDAEEQLHEIKRITESVAAIIDSDRPKAGVKSKKSIRDFKAACDRAQVSCHILQRRTLENYFPERAIRAVKGDQARALGPYETLAEAGFPWSKSEDWEIARAMTREELEQTDLGQFLGAL